MGRGESFQKHHLHTCVCPEGHMAACGHCLLCLFHFLTLGRCVNGWYLCVHMSVHVCACSCVCRWLPLLSSILSFEKGSLAGPGTHQLGKSGLPPSSCLPSSPALGLQVCTIPPSFFMGDGDLNSGSYACLASLLSPSSICRRRLGICFPVTQTQNVLIITLWPMA